MIEPDRGARPDQAFGAGLVASVAAGAVAGAVDLFVACAINSASPTRIARTIADGVLGARTFHTAGSAWLGGGLQIGLGALIGLIYWPARTLAASRFGRPMTALGGGVAIFLMMNYLVLPLSAWRRFPKFTFERGALNLLAMLLFSAIVLYGADMLLKAGRRAKIRGA